MLIIGPFHSPWSLYNICHPAGTVVQAPPHVSDGWNLAVFWRQLHGHKPVVEFIHEMLPACICETMSPIVSETIVIMLIHIAHRIVAFVRSWEPPGNSLWNQVLTALIISTFVPSFHTFIGRFLWPPSMAYLASFVLRTLIHVAIFPVDFFALVPSSLCRSVGVMSWAEVVVAKA